LDYFLMSSYLEDPPRSTDRPVHPLERRPAQAPQSPPTPQPVYPTRRLELPHSPPIFTYILIGVNILIFVIDSLTGRMLTIAGAKENFAILQGEYWRFITPMFLHGGLLHIGLNCYFLYNVGPQVERSFGHFRFLAIYFLCGLAASIASFALSPNPSVGASGALFGLIGALLPLLYRNRQVLANTSRRIGGILQVIVINLIFGFTVPRIDNWAHIGGLLAGLALAWLTTPRYVVRLALTGEAERIDDETSTAIALVWFGITGLILVGLAFALIRLRSS
jgi:rhomboid protease GluP